MFRLCWKDDAAAALQLLLATSEEERHRRRQRTCAHTLSFTTWLRRKMPAWLWQDSASCTDDFFVAAELSREGRDVTRLPCLSTVICSRQSPPWICCRTRWMQRQHSCTADCQERALPALQVSLVNSALAGGCVQRRLYQDLLAKSAVRVCPEGLRVANAPSDERAS